MTEIYQSQEFSVEFENLKRRKAEGQGESEYLLKIIEKWIEKLKQNHEAGQKIPRQLWPKYYVQKYGVNNMWRFQLDDDLHTHSSRSKACCSYFGSHGPQRLQ